MTTYRWHDNPRIYGSSHLYANNNERPMCNNPRATKGPESRTNAPLPTSCLHCRRWWGRLTANQKDTRK